MAIVHVHRHAYECLNAAYALNRMGVESIRNDQMSQIIQESITASRVMQLVQFVQLDVDHMFVHMVPMCMSEAPACLTQADLGCAIHVNNFAETRRSRFVSSASSKNQAVSWKAADIGLCGHINPPIWRRKLKAFAPKAFQGEHCTYIPSGVEL